MSNEGPTREQQIIGLMLESHDALGIDLWAADALQNLAALCAKLEPHLSAEDMAVLVRIGGNIAHFGLAETQAGMEAYLAIKGAGEPRRNTD